MVVLPLGFPVKPPKKVGYPQKRQPGGAKRDSPKSPAQAPWRMASDVARHPDPTESTSRCRRPFGGLAPGGLDLGLSWFLLRGG